MHAVLASRATRGRVAPPSPRWRAALAGALAGALLATGVPAAVGAVHEAVVAAQARAAAQREAARVAPRYELPLEWRWSPPRVDVDAMFRRRR